MASIDFASARGTKLNDIVVDHRPSTGRGKKLTLAQEGVLKRLYEQKLPAVSNGELPAKKFWLDVASRFHEETGREYSWLSVKRRAAGWRQKSPEVDQRLDASHASKLGIEDLVIEPNHQDISHQSLSEQNSYARKQLTLSQKPSLHPRGSNTLGLSQIERSPGVTEPTQDTSRNLESLLISQPRTRSTSPQRVSQPKYRHRSPSTMRRTKLVSKRLHHQLASPADGIVDSGPDPLSDSSGAYENVQPIYPGKRNPAGFNRIRESVEQNEPEKNARNSAISKHGVNKVSNRLLASPGLSGQDDLPLAPTRIMRRRVAK
ncbi:hypothetical protein CBS147332_5942 [Penicillium roqueforti]|nr:hypothetical protein CBS147332_5942 [Penicillium roqueforti]KAI3114439.1 hypothetical protein CBS147331_4251 [Penicillium roqueforti]